MRPMHAIELLMSGRSYSLVILITTAMTGLTVGCEDSEPRRAKAIPSPGQRAEKPDTEIPIAQSDSDAKNGTPAPSRTANIDQVKRLRRATSIIRKRRYAQQKAVALHGIGESARNALPSVTPGKLVGYELFNNMSGLMPRPGTQTIRLRYISLLYGSRLSHQLKASLESLGWSPGKVSERGTVRDPKLGRLAWQRIEPVDQPSQIEITITPNRAILPNPQVTQLISTRPPWWDVLSKSAVYGFEYSRFHHFKKVAAFTDLERVAVGVEVIESDDLKTKLYQAAKRAGFKPHGSAVNVLAKPPNTTLTVTMPTATRMIVHFQKRWIVDAHELDPVANPPTHSTP